MEPHDVGIDTIQDLNTGKFYRFDQRTGETLRCNAQGEPIPFFKRDYTGYVGGKKRKERGLQVEALARGLDLLPQRLGIPGKYVGYVCMPRPGLDINARGEECAFTLPKYLHPVRPKLGRISTTSVAVKQKKASRQATMPSFLDCLDSQFLETQSMNGFIAEDSEFHEIRNAADIEATVARNRQNALAATADDEEKDTQSVTTKGRFGRTAPPWNPEEMKAKEQARDRLVCPEKWAINDEKIKADKAAVAKRRRDRYPDHFKRVDEQRRSVEAAKSRPSVITAGGDASKCSGSLDASVE